MTNLLAPKLTEAQLEKMARMIHAGIPEKQLAGILQIDIANLPQILESQDFCTQLAIIEQDAFDNAQLKNEGWDGIEEKAMVHVLQALEGNADPDYALKAAVMANKAQRRGGNKHINSPIEIAPNLQTVIELHPVFVGELQQTFNINERKLEELPLKDTNMLSVKGVHSLLGLDKEGETYEVEAQPLDGLDEALVTI